MRLTAKKSVELSIELWAWLSETGEDKIVWPKWEHNGGQYPSIPTCCFLCEYDYRARIRRGTNIPCEFCPYWLKYGDCDDDAGKNPYSNWVSTSSEKAKKKYAKQFLEQLKEILKDMEAK